MKDTDVLNPMPDLELLGYTLDLARPELATVMDRYSPMSPHVPEELLDPPTALIVTRRERQEESIKKELESEGWSVKVCPGPGHKLCPVMHGERCTLRESADTAVVFVDPMESQVGSLPRVRCAADESSPAVVAVEGSFQGIRSVGSTATVGALWGPGVITSAIGELLNPFSDPSEEA